MAEALHVHTRPDPHIWLFNIEYRMTSVVFTSHLVDDNCCMELQTEGALAAEENRLNPGDIFDGYIGCILCIRISYLPVN